MPRETALSDRDEHEFFVPEPARWEAISAASMNLGETLNIASHAIEDAYEYLIYQFADDAGKKGGEFYTPREVVRLIVELLEPQEGMRICDPAAGVRRNADLHRPARAGAGRRRPQPGAARSRAQPGDSGHRQAQPAAPRPAVRPDGGRRRIAEPGLMDPTGRLLSYDRVIANPPFSLKNWGHDFAPNDPHHRFDRYGAVPPKTRGDFAFLLHMLGVTNAQGMVGVVMPHGILFRGGAEGKIRRGMVEADLFEAVIGLAPNLFFGASIPVAVCVLNKAKPAKRKGKVLFVDAAQEGYFRPGKAQNYMDPEHIEKIVRVYHAIEDVDRFAHVADLTEIEANDFNLNISRYVDTTEPVEVMSVEEALAQLREAERRRDEAVARMDELLAGMGYAR